MDKTGGPAFPMLPWTEVHANGDKDTHEAVHGMSLLDWFAGQALCGFIAMHADPEITSCIPKEVAHEVWKFADAMLAEREKRK